MQISPQKKEKSCDGENRPVQDAPAGPTGAGIQRGDGRWAAVPQHARRRPTQGFR